MSDFNPYNFYAKVTIDMLMGNLQTLSVQNDTLNLWTVTSQNLTEQWTTGSPKDNPDPNAQALWNAAVGITSNADMGNFITTYLSSNYLYYFSQQFGTSLMELLSCNNSTDPLTGATGVTVWDATNGPSQMNIINQFNSLIGSTAQNDEQLGQQETKTENSEQQQSAGNQQTLSDGFNAVSEAAANTASILNQGF